MAETLPTQGRQTHEQRDVYTRAVVCFGGALVLLLAGSLTLVGWLLSDLQAQIQQHEIIPTALLEERPQPPEPHLHTEVRKTCWEISRSIMRNKQIILFR